MSTETIERCDICGRVVSDVLRDDSDYSLRHEGYGYIKAKRIIWQFGPFPQRVWHRVDRGWEIICDICLDAVREVSLAAAGVGGGDG